jgi:hypothetical protein
MSKLKLKTSHLIIESELAKQVLGDTPHVYMKFLPEKKSLLITSVKHNWFDRLHPGCSMNMLKERNLQGDKTIALHEVLIDQELDDADRELSFDVQANQTILNVHF